MGKNLKGKECGKGIYQRKDGLYSARFVNEQGKRQEKCFSTGQEARNWLEKAKYEDKHYSKDGFYYALKEFPYYVQINLHI